MTVITEQGMQNLKFQQGKPYPLGAAITEDGINFALFSKHAKSINLCFFSIDTQEALLEIPLDPKTHRTGDIWHVLIDSLPLPISYGYRLKCPKSKRGGPHRYDPAQIVLDPYATVLASSVEWGDKTPYAPMGIVQDVKAFDWEGDIFPGYPMEDLIIYEMHVRSFTKSSSSNVEHPGTFLGVIEKIPYLLDLGVNAVELMPVFEFNEMEYHGQNPLTNERLYNVWGYSPVNFFAPMRRYASGKDPSAAILEFKQMVRALHANGIEVILDVVYNHTAEGADGGPVYSFKGIDNKVYYMLDGDNHYFNFSGCGNTFNANHPVCRSLILESLRYWVAEMHVDGFRFDLASALTRNPLGQALQYPPVIEEISHDPILSKIKLIAEPWDVGGLYQVGSFFPHENRWSEWNGRYRDTVRSFINGNYDAHSQFATRITGSFNLYGNRTPKASINFITAHDGFTLRDLVSYNHKHNLSNGEGNRDGTDSNLSFNCGAEGVTDDPAVIVLRERQMRNFILTLMLSKGVPMLLMGDEYGHTRKGNNNAWCQDNDLNYFLWDSVKGSSLFRFVKMAIDFRKRHPVLRRDCFYTDQELMWYDPEGNPIIWEEPNSYAAFHLKSEGEDLFFAINIAAEEITYKLPPHLPWKTIAYTAAPPPYDFYEDSNAPLIHEGIFQMKMRSSFLAKASHLHTNKSETSP